MCHFAGASTRHEGYSPRIDELSSKNDTRSLWVPRLVRTVARRDSPQQGPLALQAPLCLRALRDLLNGRLKDGRDLFGR